MTRWMRLLLAAVLLAFTMVAGSTTTASADPRPVESSEDQGTGTACQEGPRGAKESQYLPMTRWSGATTDFHSRLSWNDIVDKVQRNALMETGMSVGNFLYSFSEYMVTGALEFCLLDKAGYELDSAAAGIGDLLLDSPLVTVLLAAAIIMAAFLSYRGKGKEGLRSLVNKAVILGIMVVMVAGASASTETNGGDYDPGTFSPGWFAVTVDTAVTTLANAPVAGIYEQASGVTGADDDPNSKEADNIFDCDVHMAAMRSKYKQTYADERLEATSALLPMVMSSIWENSGLATWRIAQYGKDNDLSHLTYCHHLDMVAQPSRETTLGLMEEIHPAYKGWGEQEINGSLLVDSQVFNPQSDKAQDIAIIAWAACRPAGDSFGAQVDNLKEHRTIDGQVNKRWTTDGTLMVRGGLDDSTLTGDLSQLIKEGVGGVGDKVENKLGALAEGTQIGLAVKAWNVSKNSLSRLRGLSWGKKKKNSGGGDEYDPNLKPAEQSAACASLFNWNTERDNIGWPESLTSVEYGADEFNWGNEAGNIKAFATYTAADDDGQSASRTDEARDFLLTLHGNKNMTGVIGVLIYLLSAVGMVVVFGLLAGAVLLAKVMAGVFIIACFFVLVGSLATNRDMESVAKFAKAYLGLSLFAWGAIALLAVIGLLSGILATLGEAFGGWLAILWAGMSPLLSAIVLHKVFKDILHLPSPFKLTAGLAFANTMAKSGATNAFSGLDQMAGKGAGMVKRTASTAGGVAAANLLGGRGKGPGSRDGVRGRLKPKQAEPPSGKPSEKPLSKGEAAAEANTPARPNPTGEEAKARRAALQQRANDPELSLGERKAARRQLRAEDKQQREAALQRAAEAKRRARQNSSFKQRAWQAVRHPSGATKAAVAGGVVAGVPGAVVAGGAVAGVQGARKVATAARDGVANLTGLGHNAMMERAQQELDAWYAANEDQRKSKG